MTQLNKAAIKKILLRHKDYLRSRDTALDIAIELFDYPDLEIVEIIEEAMKEAKKFDHQDFIALAAGFFIVGFVAFCVYHNMSTLCGAVPDGLTIH